MKKFLDDVFCEQLIEKKLLDKKKLAQAKREPDIITIREKLLLGKYISYTPYASTLASLRGDRNLMDSPKSIEFDQKFLSYAQSQNLIPKEDIELCRKHARTSAVTTRELLLLTATIDLETYTQIMSELVSMELPHKKRVEEEEPTIIDEEGPSLLEEDEAEDRKASPGKKDAPLSLVRENSAETLINIDSADEEEEKGFSRAPFRTPTDGSAATLVDQEFDIEKAASSLDDMTIDLPPGQAESPHNELEATLDVPENEVLPVEEDAAVPLSHHKISPGKTDPRLKKATIKETMMPTMRETMLKSKIHPPSQTATAPALPMMSMDELIQEVQKQVNLQTQQISQSFGKEISTYTSIYRSLRGMVIFIFLFLFAFTGWIEYQRFEDLSVLRIEKKQALDQKDQVLAQLSQVQAQLTSVGEKKQALETQADKLPSLTQEVQSLKTEIENLKEQETARIYLQSALFYQQIQESAKAEEEAKKGWKLGKQDAYVNLMLGQYFWNQKDATKAMKYFEVAAQSQSTSGAAYAKLGEIAFSQGKYTLARDHWQKALSLTPELKRIQEKMKLLPK